MVRAVRPLRDDAFEIVLTRGVEEIDFAGGHRFNEPYT
jgi:hypothetical protein